MRDPKTYVKLNDYQKANNLQELLLIEYFCNIYIGQFELEGLPEEIPADIPARWLFWWRNVCVFKDKSGTPCALPPIMGENLSLYWRPTKWWVEGANGFREKLNESNSVIIWNDRGRTCPYWHILPWVQKIVQLRSAQDINMNAQKTPFVWSGNKNELLSAANFYEQLTGGKPVMFTSKKMSDHLKETQVFNTDVPFKGLEFSRQEQIFVNQILTYLGIVNVNVEKRERLVEDEANANTELTKLNLAARLQQQQSDWDKANKMFGWNVRVKLAAKPVFPNDGESVSDDKTSLTGLNNAVK